LTAHELVTSPPVARAGKEGWNGNNERHNGEPPRQVQQQKDQREQSHHGTAKVEGLRDHRHGLVAGLVRSLADLIVRLRILKKSQVQCVGFLQDFQLNAVRYLFLQELLHRIAERAEQA